jgi:hypothetical protein
MVGTGYAVRTAVNDWSELLIFARNGDDSPRSPAMPVIAIAQTAGVTSDHVSCNGRGLETFDSQIDAQRELK